MEKAYKIKVDMKRDNGLYYGFVKYDNKFMISKDVYRPKVGIDFFKEEDKQDMGA